MKSIFNCELGARESPSRGESTRWSQQAEESMVDIGSCDGEQHVVSRTEVACLTLPSSPQHDSDFLLVDITLILFRRIQAACSS